MTCRVFYTSQVEKQLKKLSSTDIKRVIQKTKLLTLPLSENFDIQKMVNAANFYRLRVGKVRILFEIENKQKEIWIRAIKYRGSIYK